MPSAKKLPSGNWRAQYSTGEKNEKGKYIYGSVTMPTEKEAIFAALELELKHKEAARNPTNITVSEAMRKYIESKSNVLSPSTIRGYDIIYRNNLRSIMQLKLNKLNNSIIQSAINDEALNHSPKTVKNIYGLLTAVINLHMPDFRINVRLPQSEKKIKTVLSDIEISSLIKEIKGNPIEVPVLLALWLGMRQSEICGLKWNCIDFKKGIVIIKQAKVRDKDDNAVMKTTKTFSSTRKLKVPNFVLEKLRDMPKESEYVVTLSGTAIYKRFKRLLEKHELPPEISFHDLRMMNASIMLKLKIPDKYAMERGGWNNTATMKNVYQQLFDDERVVVDDTVDSYFESLIEEDLTDKSHELSHEK